MGIDGLMPCKSAEQGERPTTCEQAELVGLRERGTEGMSSFVCALARNAEGAEPSRIFR